MTIKIKLGDHMTIGVGGSTAEIELAKLQDMTTDISAIALTEFEQRIKKAALLLKNSSYSKKPLKTLQIKFWTGFFHKNALFFPPKQPCMDFPLL